MYFTSNPVPFSIFERQKRAPKAETTCSKSPTRSTTQTHTLTRLGGSDKKGCLKGLCSEAFLKQKSLQILMKTLLRRLTRQPKVCVCVWGAGSAANDQPGPVTWAKRNTKNTHTHTLAVCFLLLPPVSVCHLASLRMCVSRKVRPGSDLL